MLVVGLAIAQNPFGGDDGGFITSNKGFAKCENSVAKNLGKAAACILGCHKKRAKRSLADDTAEDNCENNLPASADCRASTTRPPAMRIRSTRTARPVWTRPRVPTSSTPSRGSSTATTTRGERRQRGIDLPGGRVDPRAVVCLIESRQIGEPDDREQREPACADHWRALNPVGSRS